MNKVHVLKGSKQKKMFQFIIHVHVKGSGFQTALYKLKYFMHACMS